MYIVTSNYIQLLPTIMKKIIWTLIIGTLLMISCGIKNKTKSGTDNQVGWYFETEKKESSKIVKDHFSDNIYYVQKEPIITVQDFKSMKIEKPNWGGQARTIIGVELNEDVKEKWGDLTERMSKTNEKALFIYKNEVISNLSAFQRMDNGYAMITHDSLSENMLEEIIKNIDLNK